ncbi:MAG: hypothetical protein JHD16_16295 [Solirubrobacteraceae bacterium]|nr:hypothetical protein [Solirubrobacteraceae bacterium]
MKSPVRPGVVPSQTTTLRTRRSGAARCALLAILALAVGSAPASAEPIRIMPVGDSITQGAGGDYTWRYRLANSLRLNGPASGVDFVGSRTGLYDTVKYLQDWNQDYQIAEFDRDHHAVWLRTLIDETATIGPAIGALPAKPDVVIAALGTNDAARGAARSLTAMESLIRNARAAAPGVDVVVVGLYPLANLGNGALINQSYVAGFNAGLPALASRLSTPSERVVLAPLASFDPRTMTWDGRHPTSTGELVIARSVATALAELGVGGGWRGPSTAVWPAQGPTPSLIPASNGTVRVTWPVDTPGALAYRVTYRLVGTSAWTLVGTLAANTPTVTAPGMKVGSSYEFAITPVRGAMVGVMGPRVTTTIPAPVPRSKPWWQLW